jgi:phenylalanyl-tRNA synthetase alpha chain
MASRPASARRWRGRKAELERGALSARPATEKADITLPVRHRPLAGWTHPSGEQVFDEIAEIFGDMGFAIAEGPDIETDDLNFTKLNIPPEHPARQEHDTFYMKGSGRDGRQQPGQGPAPRTPARCRSAP